MYRLATLLVAGALCCAAEARAQTAPPSGSCTKTDPLVESLRAAAGATTFAPVPGGFSLPGFEETILVASSSAPPELAVVRVGTTTSAVHVELTDDARIRDTRSRFGKFFLLLSNGALVTIDGSDGSVLSHADLDVTDPYALEVVSDSEAFVTSKTSGTITRINVHTGATLSTLEVTATDGVALGGRHPLQVGERLYVALSRGEPSQGTELAVIDTSTDQVLDHTEIYWTSETGEIRRPLNPDFPLVLDAPRHRLFVGARGRRPSNTGMTLKVDLESLEVDSDPTDLSATFNGHLAISQSQQKVFRLEHTSTPVSSTHVAVWNLLPDGELEPAPGPTLLDLFEVSDELSFNDDGTLAILPNSCPVGFCTTGKGVNFIDVATGENLPKLTDAHIGFAPSFAVYLR